MASAEPSIHRSAPRDTPLAHSSSEGGDVSARVDRRRPGNAVLLRHTNERAKSLQNRIADAITGFAGTMDFVYIHVVLFAIWMLWLERSPWPTLTLAVSLEAIFHSTFVMISQNRADERRQVLADHQWEFVQTEERQNEELLRLSTQILELTKTIHAFALQAEASGAPQDSAESRSDT
jgi:uncharacterized membrane protein